MVGSAIIRVLQKRGYSQIVTQPRNELDLTDQAQVRQFFAGQKFDQVYLCASRVGGIHANNTYPAEFIYENLMIESNVVHEAWKSGVQKLLFLGSSCIYPRLAPQPMAEDALMMGPLEPTNEPYAMAKIAGIKLCESYNRQYGADYRSVMPTNLYGPGDNYHPLNAHVIPALIGRFHRAKLDNAEKVVIWGTGAPRREFLHVDDMAEAGVFVMEMDRARYESNTKPMQTHINVGYGEDVTIRELAELVAKVTGFRGRIEFDTTKPDGSPRKLLDVALLKSLGWKPVMDLARGLEGTYADFVKSPRRERA